jgi:soluble lytic murein transglycosylase-like protein
MIAYEDVGPATPRLYARTTVVPSEAILASAQKWAVFYGLPVSWVLATIFLESKGDPRAHAKTAKEDSYGLMQINVRAAGQKLASLGVKREQLWDPDTNIRVGTAILRDAYDAVSRLLAHAPAQSLPVDAITRLYYAGPRHVQRALSAGRDASASFKNAARYASNWKLAMAQVSGVT